MFLTAGTGTIGDGGTITFDNQSINNTGLSVLADDELLFSNDLVEISDTYRKLQSHTSSTTTDDYEDETRWYAEGQRYGIDPQHAQDNGSYFIDNIQGRVFFNSTLSGIGFFI